MSASLDEIIAAAGYAKVIVTLNVEKSIAAAALSAAVSAGAVESELQNYFIVPSPLQAQSLAAAAVHVAGKRVAKTRPTPPRIRVTKDSRSRLVTWMEAGPKHFDSTHESAGWMGHRN